MTLCCLCQDFKVNADLSAEEQKVVAVPEVRNFYARPSDLLLMACDGEVCVAFLFLVSRIGIVSRVRTPS